MFSKSRFTHIVKLGIVFERIYIWVYGRQLPLVLFCKIFWIWKYLQINSDWIYQMV